MPLHPLTQPTRPHTPSHTLTHSHATQSHTQSHAPSPGAGERGGRGTQDAGTHPQVAHLQVTAGSEPERGCRPPRPGAEGGQAAGHRLWGAGLLRSSLRDRRFASRAQRRAESRRGAAARRRGGGGGRGRSVEHASAGEHARLRAAHQQRDAAGDEEDQQRGAVPGPDPGPSPKRQTEDSESAKHGGVDLGVHSVVRAPMGHGVVRGRWL